ncbi:MULTISPECIES: ankyrin repeat domain-containing protein [unclassified Microbacterium]|uniref:ankyrin repeat domain-containing protein n=1 Tax=unclassified Microbacterium TaxID=2609290 RepID=UPI001E28CC22|nr:ankyrin repeat domain-containing protein [Microbacterium sp. Au-Mic1]MCE4027730.1 ankyrin repeat domain-containing protein [Microbacterium sp. Au-Mic1]
MPSIARRPDIARPPGAASLRKRVVGALAGLGVAALLLAGCAASATEAVGVPTVTSTPPSTAPAPSPAQRTEAEMTALNSRLFEAASTGDAEAVRAAIAEGADLEARGSGGMTALIAATKGNRIDAALALIDAGADVNAKDDIVDSAYLYAGARGHDEILRATLEHGADLRSTNRYGGTALIPASERGHLGTVKILLAAGVDPNHVNNLNWTALHEAIVLGDGSKTYVDIVRTLIAGGADITIRDGDGVLPRDLAAARGYRDIVAAIDKA